MSRWSTCVLVSVLSSSCSIVHFSRPPSGIEASGERLDVREITTAHTSMEQREVGSVQYRDSSGASLGSAKVYEDVPVTTYRTNWYLFQGEQKVDDVDFYRIAGDLEASARAEKYRSSGVLFTWLGLGLSGTGLATTLALSAANAGLWSYSGLIGAVAGAILTTIGQIRLAPQNHVFNSTKAINTANAYNRRVAQAPYLRPSARR